MKIAFVGAGSVVFTKNLLTDVFSFPELRGVTVALHDMDSERLETAGMMARWTSGRLGAGAKVEEHADRRAALEGADFVINAVQIGMHQATLLDFEIPRKYGLKQTIADSMGIGGIFRGLRTIPFVLGLARDMRDLCPEALLLNYTNPMGILMETLYTAYPEVESVGLCHSVPYTAREISSYIGIDHEDLLYECAGINHIAWMTRLEVDGEDAYPRLFAAMDDPDVYKKDKVRFELMRRFGLFVTESSEHNAEYTPYFLKDDWQISAHDVPVDEYVRRSEENLAGYADTRRKLLAGEEFPLERSVEYGPLIIHSMLTGQARAIYGNVKNVGLVTNLPEGCCVEVPVLVDGTGLRPCYVGDLPPQRAAACAPHTAVQNLTVRAALEGRRDHVHHAAMLDRHAPSVLSLGEISAMVDDLIEAHGDALPEGISTPPGSKGTANRIEAYWQAYLETLPDDSPARNEGYEAWAFGDGPEMADALGALVVSGRKTATCSALWELEADGEPVARPGEKSVILDGTDEPLCIIETTGVEIRRFDEVDGRFAHDEGEGDRSLEYWREAHRRFFARTLPEIGRGFAEDMPLVCERFRVVYA